MTDDKRPKVSIGFGLHRVCFISRELTLTKKTTRGMEFLNDSRDKLPLDIE